jgi:hypothetical protein
MTRAISAPTPRGSALRVSASAQGVLDCQPILKLMGLARTRDAPRVSKAHQTSPGRFRDLLLLCGSYLRAIHATRLSTAMPLLQKASL